MLMLRGHAVPGFALGAIGAASTFAQASTDLQNQVVAVVAAGDTYYAGNVAGFSQDFSDAVLAYQAAGQAGATNVAPEIDSSGSAAATSPITGQARALNAQLQALAKSGLPDSRNKIAAYFNQSDADKAKSLVSQMVTLYGQAISAGEAASATSTASTTGTTTTTPVQTPTTTAPVAVVKPNPWPVIGLGAAVAAVATVMISRSSHAYV